MKPLSLIPKKQAQQIESTAALDTYWSLTTEQLLDELHTTRIGIPQLDAENRLKQYGPNPKKPNKKTRRLGYG